ncbi:DJ-1/PfpI family protein [Pseudomonas sp. R1-15]|uniref:DJ-1/PfpI family protein n=1 Tax=Pseudomonas sp. R1-15 TaxID=2817399 RepID=UPI003DA90CAF
MKNLAIIIPPRRIDAPMLMSCLGVWRKEYNLRIFSVDVRNTDGMAFENIKAHDLEEMHSECFDAIAVMDGAGTKEYLWDNIDVIAQLQKFDKARKLVAGIGLGSIVLAQAGVLVGKEATTANSVELVIKLKSYGTIFIPDDVVTLKWVITGNGKDVEAFAHAVSIWLRTSPRQTIK